MKAILASQADQVSVGFHKNFYCSHTHQVLMSEIWGQKIKVFSPEYEESPVAKV